MPLVPACQSSLCPRIYSPAHTYSRPSDLGVMQASLRSMAAWRAAIRPGSTTANATRLATSRSVSTMAQTASLDMESASWRLMAPITAGRFRRRAVVSPARCGRTSTHTSTRKATPISPRLASVAITRAATPMAIWHLGATRSQRRRCGTTARCHRRLACHVTFAGGFPCATIRAS